MTLLGERRTYVAGRWIDGDDTMAVENPADETHVTDVCLTPIAEIERAVLEARRTFDAGVWADLPVGEAEPGSCTPSSTTWRLARRNSSPR